MPLSLPVDPTVPLAVPVLVGVSPPPLDWLAVPLLLVPDGFAAGALELSDGELLLCTGGGELVDPPPADDAPVSPDPAEEFVGELVELPEGVEEVALEPPDAGADELWSEPADCGEVTAVDELVAGEAIAVSCAEAFSAGGGDSGASAGTVN